MQLEVPTTEEIRSAVRDELSNFFLNFQFPQEHDEIGRGAKFASDVTGKAVPTIYALVSLREIPHSKRGKDLYFSRKELEEWMRSGKRKTQQEAAEIASTRRLAR